MKFFIVFLLLSFSVLSFAQNILPQKAQLSALETYLSKVERAIWSLKTSKLFGGTGFFISPNHFITNFHVIDYLLKDSKEQEIHLTQKDHLSKIHVKKILAVFALHDLALIETKESSNDYLKLREEPVETNENLFISGYPDGLFKRVRKTGDAIYKDNYLYSYPISHYPLRGASGSPVLDKQGQVVGVHFKSENYIGSMTKIIRLKEVITKMIKQDCNKSFLQCKKEFLNQLEDRVKENDVLATYNLGQIHYAGAVVNKNLEEAFKYLKKAAEQNYIPAQYDLGIMYYFGEGVTQNFQESFKWIKKATEQNYAPAQHWLGWMYYKGKGVQKNLETAFEYTKKAAEQSYVIAQSELALMYYNGEGVPKNLEESLKWFEKAAQQNYPFAQYRLALMYYNGEGVVQNFQTAFYWTEKSKQQNHKKGTELYNQIKDLFSLDRSGCKSNFL